MEKQYIIQCNAEELSALFLGLQALQQALTKDVNTKMAEIRIVENLHQRIRPDVQAAIDQSSQIATNE